MSEALGSEKVSIRVTLDQVRLIACALDSIGEHEFSRRVEAFRVKELKLRKEMVEGVAVSPDKQKAQYAGAQEAHKDTHFDQLRRMDNSGLIDDLFGILRK